MGGGGLQRQQAVRPEALARSATVGVYSLCALEQWGACGAVCWLCTPADGHSHRLWAGGEESVHPSTDERTWIRKKPLWTRESNKERREWGAGGRGQEGGRRPAAGYEEASGGRRGATIKKSAHGIPGRGEAGAHQQGTTPHERLAIGPSRRIAWPVLPCHPRRRITSSHFLPRHSSPASKVTTSQIRLPHAMAASMAPAKGSNRAKRTIGPGRTQGEDHGIDPVQPSGDVGEPAARKPRGLARVAPRRRRCAKLSQHRPSPPLPVCVWCVCE